MNRRHFISSSATALAATALSATESNKKTVWGIAELWQWLYEKQQTSGHDSADCLQAHLDHGIRHVMWALGRSTLDYHSALPTSTMYAGDTRPETKVIGDSFRQECSLRAALAFAEKNNMVIYGRLGMNRHYGDSLGGGLRSKYIAAHPEWMERHRGGQVDGTKVSFAIPEYRAERIAVLLEVAKIGAHGLCLDFCRQPPIARYHPQILDPWLKAGHADPRQMRTGSPEFLEWAQHRADFVNLFIRDLRAQLRELGLLLRPRPERQCRRRRHFQSSQQLPLADHLARPRLRTLRRESLWPSRFRTRQARRRWRLHHQKRRQPHSALPFLFRQRPAEDRGAGREIPRLRQRKIDIL
jgi:hypothetical protein